VLKPAPHDPKLAAASQFWTRVLARTRRAPRSAGEWLRESLWSSEPLEPRALGWLRGALQFSVVVAQGFVRDHLLLRAHSLTFLTVLSLVPLLALAVSMVTLFGVGDDLDLTRQILSQVAAGSPEAVDWILPYVKGLNFGQLGSLGAAVLLGTTVLTVGAVERSLNAIYGIRRQRTWIRRIPDYLAVLLISPLVLGIAVSLRTTLESQWIVDRALQIPLFATAYGLGLKQAATVLYVIGLTFVYWFLPNTSVRLRSALLGGLVAGLLVTVMHKLYVGFNVGVFRYETIFGSVAFLPLLLVWIYLSWAVILLGAEVAYAHQTLPLYRREVRGAPPGSAALETVGIAIALEVARAFRDGKQVWNAESLSDALDVPLRTVRGVVAELEEAGIVAPRETEERPGAIQLARPAEQISVGDVLLALRGSRETAIGIEDLRRTVVKVTREIDRGADQAEATSLADLLRELDSAIPATAPVDTQPVDD
jgi:membrane protein